MRVCVCACVCVCDVMLKSICKALLPDVSPKRTLRVCVCVRARSDVSRLYRFSAWSLVHIKNGFSAV